MLSVVTGHETDFWNNTFYGFRHTNGHFLGTPVTGDFSLTVTVLRRLLTALRPGRRDAARSTTTTGSNAASSMPMAGKNFSVVVTRDNQSDWSVMPIEGAPGAPVTLRLHATRRSASRPA